VISAVRRSHSSWSNGFTSVRLNTRETVRPLLLALGAGTLRDCAPPRFVRLVASFVAGLSVTTSLPGNLPFPATCPPVSFKLITSASSILSLKRETTRFQTTSNGDAPQSMALHIVFQAKNTFICFFSQNPAFHLCFLRTLGARVRADGGAPDILESPKPPGSYQSRSVHSGVSDNAHR
jgi:hypothetical protein